MLWDLSEVLYPRRTRDGALRLVATANGASSKRAAKDILSRQSIRDVLVSDISDNHTLFESLTVCRTRF